MVPYFARVAVTGWSAVEGGLISGETKEVRGRTCLRLSQIQHSYTNTIIDTNTDRKWIDFWAGKGGQREDTPPVIL